MSKWFRGNLTLNGSLRATTAADLQISLHQRSLVVAELLHGGSHALGVVGLELGQGTGAQLHRIGVLAVEDRRQPVLCVRAQRSRLEVDTSRSVGERAGQRMGLSKWRR